MQESLDILNTVLSLYNILQYNKDLDTTWSCCAPKCFTMEFTRNYRNMTMKWNGNVLVISM